MACGFLSNLLSHFPICTECVQQNATHDIVVLLLCSPRVLLQANLSLFHLSSSVSKCQMHEMLTLALRMRLRRAALLATLVLSLYISLPMGTSLAHDPSAFQLALPTTLA